jgi:hypothetical protein
MFPKVKTISIVPRLFEELRDESRRRTLMAAESRYALLRHQSVLVPNQVAEDCITRRYVSVGNILFNEATGFRFVHFTESVFQFVSTGNPIVDEVSRAKSLLDACLRDKTSYFLERRDLEIIRKRGRLDKLEMDGLMKLNGFTAEGLECAGWLIRMH